MEAKITTITETLNLVLAEVLKMNSEMDRLHPKIDALDQRMNKMEKQMDKIELRMDKLEQGMGNIEERMGVLEIRVEDSFVFTKEMVEYLGEKVFDHAERIGGLEEA